MIRTIDPSTTEQAPFTTSRLPLPVTAAVLTALAALALAKHVWGVPSLFASAVVAVYFVPARIASSPARWAMRLALFGLAIITAAAQAPSGGLDEFVDARWSNLFGYLCAAEIVVQAWVSRPGKAPLLLLLLPCGVLLAASNTYQSPWIQVLAPLFILCLGLAFPAYRRRVGGRPWSARLLAGALFLAILGLGFGSNIAVQRYQAALNAWGVQLMMMYPRGKLGLSLAPALGRGSGPRGSTERVLRVFGFQSIYYLRGMAFDTYDHGRWFPTLLDRPIKTIPPNAPPPVMAGVQLHVIKYAPLDDLLFTPISASFINTGGIINWSPEYGGPLQCSANDAMSYDVILAIHNAPTMWSPPTPAQRARMLQVPPELDPQVFTLARSIAGHSPSPHDQVQRVVLYLLTKYQYGAAIDPGPGDPVSNFLLKKKDAHCEYFASASTLMLRCLGVPTRYVVGYYAYEKQPDGSIVVRQRDAHAWAEAWVDKVGWVTVEATPSDGRPDARRENLPSWWQYVKDWLQDKLQIARVRLGSLRPRHLKIAVPAILAPYLLLLLWRLRRQRAQVRRTIFHALPADRRLAEPAARFTAWLARRDYPCPPGLPWQEHLARLETSPPAEAREFVRTYNRLRFGATGDDASLAALSALLASLEKRDPSRSS